MKMKLCIISAIAENEFLEWVDSLRFIPDEWEVFILRNKPLSDGAIKIAEKRCRVVVKENDEYRNKELETANVLLVKLRYESIMLSGAKEGDWIALGDDDMFFLEGFCENTKQIERIEDNFDFVMGTPYIQNPFCVADAKIAGIHHGQYFKYKQRVMNDYKKYIGYAGAGEDSLMASLYAKDYRCVSVWIPDIEHIGINISDYINSATQRDKRYVAAHIDDVFKGSSRAKIDAIGRKQVKLFYENLEKLDTPPTVARAYEPNASVELAADACDKRVSADSGKCLCSLGRAREKRTCSLFKPAMFDENKCYWYSFKNHCVNHKEV